MMIEQRNQLVERKRDPDGPTSPDIGIAIGFDPKIKGNFIFQVGKPVILYGAYSGDGALLLACHDNLSSAVHLVFARLDKPSVQTVRLVTPMIELPSSAGLSPSKLADGYREGGGFKVDLKAFLELPDEPGEFTIVATLGTYKSTTLRFTIKD